MEETYKKHTEHIVIQADNKNVPAAEASAATINPTAKEKHGYGKHTPLTAERIFDFTAYGVWNYGIQVGASVLAAKWFTEDGGKKYFDKTSSWLGENVLSKISKKRGIEAAEEFRTPLIFVALITVGNLFIPPIQYAEKHKAKIVGWINDKLNDRRAARGDAPDAEELKEQRQSIAAIAAEPQQTSASLWGGRALGLGANFLAAGIVGEKRNVAMKNAASDMVSGGLKSVGFEKLAESENVKSLSRIAFLDYGYSIISSNVIYLYSHIINPPKYKKGDVEKHIEHEIFTPSEPQKQVSESSQTQPNPQLMSGSTLTQLKPVNPKIESHHEPQLAI